MYVNGWAWLFGFLSRCGWFAAPTPALPHGGGGCSAAVRAFVHVFVFVCCFFATCFTYMLSAQVYVNGWGWVGLFGGSLGFCSCFRICVLFLRYLFYIHVERSGVCKWMGLGGAVRLSFCTSAVCSRALPLPNPPPLRTLRVLRGRGLLFYIHVERSGVCGEFTIQVQQLQKKASISDTAKKHQNLAGDRKWIPTVILRPLSGVA